MTIMRCRLFHILRGVLPGMLCVLMLALPARGVPPKYFDIANARVILDADEIAVALSIGLDNVTGLYEMLKDGASIELIVSATLERPRTFWANVVLADAKFFSSLQHNPLTREFALQMPGESTPLVDKNLHRLMEATWRKFTVKLGGISLLNSEKGTDYQITLTLDLQHAKPPPWLAKDFMFWSKKILTPEKVVLPFTY